MIEKKVKFKEPKAKEKQYEDAPNDGKTGSSKSRRFKVNHSLDSDEELEDEGSTSNDQKDVLDEDDIEGQEDETIRHDEGISVTPFNLKDELEEGHFDTQGNYIANKDEDATDQWLESVDWNKVENQFHSKRKGKVEKEAEEEEEEEDEHPARPPFQIMQDMISIMQPGENVLKCLRRLGGNKKPMSSADRWKKKKLKVEEVVDEKAAENAANLLKLTGLADELLQRGDFQIYEKTYEKLNVEIGSKLSQFDDADDDGPGVSCKKRKLDTEKSEEISRKMDADDIHEDDDELEAAFNTSTSKKSPTVEKDDSKFKSVIKGKQKATKPKEKVEDPGISLSDEVCWIYKLSDADVDDSEHFGPFTSTKMLELQDEGKFGEGVYCRKVGSEGSFYTSNRIDFDLYT